MNHTTTRPAAGTGRPLVRQHVMLFLDTEFTNFQDRDPLSIALVARGGREFYAELEDANVRGSSRFVAEMVAPLLRRPGAIVAPRKTVTQLLREWLEPFAGMSVVVAYDLFADLEILVDLLSGQPGAGRAVVRSGNQRAILNSLAAELGLAELIPMDVAERVSEGGLDAWFAANPAAERHHALHDARALASAFKLPFPTAA